jgi:hypothetical protein
MEDDEYQTFVEKSEAEQSDRLEWRIVSKIKLHYSAENGNEPDTIYILQPVLSGFELVKDDAPKAFAVLEEEFDSILQAV